MLTKKMFPSLLPLSDLHFEWDNKTFDYSKVINKKVADIVILAGDIAGGTYAETFIKHLLSLGYKVIYVLGNHEFYGHDIDELSAKWKSISDGLDDFYFLNNESVIIDDVEFIGSTLWTSLNTKNENENVDFFVKQSVKNNSDFRSIKLFNTDRMKNLFHFSWNKVRSIIESSTATKKVVVSHYLPSQQSIHPCYLNNPIQNYMFYTELGDYISYSNINLWIHGHTHCSFDYMIFNTRIFCNPRGYLSLNMINPEFKWAELVIKKY